MATFIINPGTEGVRNATVTLAAKAAKSFAYELGANVRVVRFGRMDVRRRPDERGYVPFWLARGKRRVRLDVPGVSLDELRSESLRTAPRLYIDGASFWWRWALTVAREALS